MSDKGGNRLIALLVSPLGSPHASGGTDEVHGDGDVAADDDDKRQQGDEGEGDPGSDVLLEHEGRPTTLLFQRPVFTVFSAPGPEDVHVFEHHHNHDADNDVHGSVWKTYLCCYMMLPCGVAMWCCHVVLLCDVAMWCCHVVLPCGVAM